MTIYSPRRCEDNCPCCIPVIRPEIPIYPQTGVFADFYAISPTDNPELIGAGEAVSFPRGYASDFSAVSRLNDSSFNLSKPGAYLVMFQVAVEEGAQLELELNGNPLAYTVAGRDTLSSQITGMAVVTTALDNSVLRVINPEQSQTEVTVIEYAGGEVPSSSHLIIVKLA